MKITLSLIKADIGSIGGHTQPSQLMLDTVQKLAQKANDFGIQEVEIFVKGPGAGRDSAIRAISNSGIKVKSIRDVTPVPHNGCRPPKRRRV